ncbi:MAG: N-acyl homoserine lactonase family protein [Ilumatobacteraceae bacterium]
METAVRLRALSTGSMTSPRGGFLEGEEGEITYPIPVFVIEHPAGLVVVDAGLHPELATTTERLRKLARTFQVHLAEDGSDSIGPLLRAAGCDPDRVAHVVLTHLHFDHTGGLLEVPNARVVVQAREWAALNDERMLDLGAYNRDDVDLGHERLELDGDHDLFGDGTVTCLLTDGHTAGHQSVRVRTEAGTYVICGDCCYLRQTLTDEHLPPVSHDRDRHLQSIRRLAAEQAQGATLLFGHDPRQWADISRDDRLRG